MSSTALPAAQGLSTRLTLIVEGLRRACAQRMRHNPAAVALLMLVVIRLSRAAARFATLAARVSQGRVPPRRVRQRQPPKPTPVPATRRHLPRGRYWLIRLVGSEAACFASQLQHLLQDPEMAALLEAAPQAGRILRPLCRMLAIKPLPAILAPPPRPREPVPRIRHAGASGVADPARPSPTRPPGRRGPPSVDEICVLAGIPPPLRA